MEIEQRWNPIIAGLLSAFIPGLGQLYKSQLLIGIVWFIAVGLGYVLFIFPGVILHVLCIIFAAIGKPNR